MLREIIKPQKASFTMRLPKEMVGKTIEVIAFEIDDTENTSNKTLRFQEIEDLTKATLVDLSGFKFDRNEANNYDELNNFARYQCIDLSS
jgi:hypothetical protein